MKINRRVAALAAGAALAGGTGIAACGGSSATMNGSLTVTTSSGASSFCSGASFSGGQGTQVTVIDPGSKVIGTGTLGAPRSSAANQLGCVVGTDVYKFTVTGLPGEPRYGVQISGEQGTIWFTPAELGHAILSIG
jgi:hypothetical protein